MPKVLTVYVVGFLFDQKGNVLLIHKRRPQWQAGKLNGIGGHIEGGETPLEAMHREFREETGLSFMRWRENIILLHQDWAVHFFSSNYGGFQRGKQQTDEEIKWVPIDALPDNCVSNLYWLIPLIRDTVVFPIIIQDIGVYDT